MRLVVRYGSETRWWREKPPAHADPGKISGGKIRDRTSSDLISSETLRCRGTDAKQTSEKTDRRRVRHAFPPFPKSTCDAAWAPGLPEAYHCSARVRKTIRRCCFLLRQSNSTSVGVPCQSVEVKLFGRVRGSSGQSNQCERVLPQIGNDFRIIFQYGNAAWCRKFAAFASLRLRIERQSLLCVLQCVVDVVTRGNTTRSIRNPHADG